MRNLLSERTLWSYFAAVVTTFIFSVFTCCASPEQERPEALRKAYDESLVIKYKQVADKYAAKMKSLKRYFMDKFNRRITRQDKDSLRFWYSQMTSRQQRRMLPYPNFKGKFDISPFNAIVNSTGRPQNILMTKEQSKHRLHYLLLLDGQILDHRVDAGLFNPLRATQKELTALVSMIYSGQESVELMDSIQAGFLWDYQKNCQGAILVSTKGRKFRNPFVMVDGCVRRVNPNCKFNAKNMTVKGYAKLVGLNPDDIQSIDVGSRVVGERRGKLDSGQRGIIVSIGTK